MKYIPTFILLIVFAACSRQPDRTQALQIQIDSLQHKLDHVYKPGLGEFMSDIQVHHAKLWFAGQSRNWKLANFEINEIKEAIDNIKEYCADRQEVKAIGMIDPAMDSISMSVQREEIVQFRNNYVVVTNTCNNCHRATAHEYNVIRIPDNPPFSNQVFDAVK